MGIYRMPFKSNHFDYRISGKYNSTVDRNNRHSIYVSDRFFLHITLYEDWLENREIIATLAV